MFGRLRQKIADGLRKTRAAITEQVERIATAGRPVDDALLDELEEMLVAADLGPELAAELRDRLGDRLRGRVVEGPATVLTALRGELLSLLPAAPEERVPATPPRVTLIVGVNGSGKTTTAGKLAALWGRQGKRVVVAAADTFRAAAVEQMAIWAERTGAQVIRSQAGTDPAAVAFDAARAARARAADEFLVDTAGRLHNKKPLMDELAKIARVVAKEIDDAPHETLLVVDGTTGRNGVAQAREFARVARITGLVLTKLDGTARGGVALSIGRELGIPVRYVGVGEGAEDLLEFDPEEYVSGLLVPGSSAASAGER